jgi:ATP-dependent helicase HrpB
VRDQSDRWARAAGADPREPIVPEAAGRILAQVFTERVGRAVGDRPGGFALAVGRAAQVEDTSPLARERWICVADLTGAAQSARITAAAALSDADLEDHLRAHARHEEAVSVESGTLAVKARRVTWLGRLKVSETPLPRPSPERLLEALAEAVAGGWQGWAPEALALIARVAALRAARPGAGWPALTPESLCSDPHVWLETLTEGGTRGGPFTGAEQVRALEALLDHDQVRRLAREAPVTWTSPAGAAHAIDWQSPQAPAVDVRLQEVLGLASHPCLPGGAPLTLRLLSPAGRPIQTTRDLPGFWRGTYAEVKSEMRGRYPRHVWPDDPATAQPTLRAKPRG